MEQRNKGVAGLSILLSLIVMLFVIGLLVMIFAIMSGQMLDTDSLYTRSNSVSVANESISPTGVGVLATTAVGKRSPICTLNEVYNGTTILANGNLTEVSECTFRNNSLYTAWKISYSYTFLADESGAVGTINDSTSAISSVVDWYDIFIVIGAMVVLILLVVVIISAIKGSGMIAGANTSGANRVGTA